MPFFGKPPKACGHCGQSIDANAKFCPYCGQPTEVAGVPCPHCGQAVAANARFCPHCGRQLGGARAPDLRGGVWRKSPDEFAVRVEPADLRGTFYRELEVQPGQQVVLLVDGRADEQRQGPGRYTVDSLFERVLTLGAGRHVTGLLVDGGYVPLEFQLPKIYTQDAYEVGVRCVVGVEVANPVAFFTNVLKSQRTLTVGDLRSFLYDEVRDAVQDVIGQQDIRQLATGLAQRDRLANAVDIYLNNTLATSGLRFGGVRTVEVSHPQLEALRAQWETIRLARDQAEADLTQERERKLAEVKRREELWQADIAETEQKTREQREQVRTYEERAALWEQARRAILSEEMNQVRTKQDLADFLASINKQQTLRQEDLDVLAEGFDQRKEDRGKARAHAAYLAELERDYNRKQADLVWRTDFTLEEMASSLKVEQQRLADAGLLDGKRWDNDMAALRRQADRTEWDRAETLKTDLFRRKTETDEFGHQGALATAKAELDAKLTAIRGDSRRSEAEKDAASQLAVSEYEVKRTRILHEEQMRQEDEERKRDKEDVEDGIAWLAKMKQNKLAAEEQARRIAREDEITRTEAALKADLARKEAERLDKAQALAHELAMFQARGQMSAEALMSLSAPDQARAIADLKKTDAMKGMTDEQVYAMMAAQSPAVAQALAERFKAAAARPAEVDAQTRALYERMLADIQRDREKEAELHTRTEDRFQQMFTQALDSQRTGMVDIARATSGQAPAPSGPVVIMNPATGQPQVIHTGGPGGVQVGGGGSERVQVCPHCHIESPVGVRFCRNCGQSFYEA